MLRVGTNDHDPTAPTDYAALFTNFFNRCSDFHANWRNYCKLNIITFYNELSRAIALQFSQMAIHQMDNALILGIKPRKSWLFFVPQSVRDAPFTQIVGGQFDFDAIAWKNFNIVTANFTGDVG